MKKNRGFASVLVLIMAVIIFSIGFSIMSSAITTDNLAEKKFEFIRDYYYIEGELNQAIVITKKYYAGGILDIPKVYKGFKDALDSDKIEYSVTTVGNRGTNFVVSARYKNNDDQRGVAALLEIKDGNLHLVEKKYIFDEEGYESFYAK